MSIADMAVMETFKLLNQVRSQGPRTEKVEIAQLKPTYYRPRPPPKEKQQKIDPLRVLDPARKKLTTVESQRVLASLDESIKRAEIVTLLPFIQQNIDRFNVVLGSELMNAIQEHIQLQEAYLEKACLLKTNDNISRTGSKSERSTPFSQRSRDLSQHEGSRTSSAVSQASGDESKPEDIESTANVDKELLHSVRLLEKHLHFSCKNILRLFSMNPAAVKAIRSEGQFRDDQSDAMITYLIELKEFILEKLLTTPLEEEEKKKYVTEITVRERKNAEVIKKLEAELQTAVDEKDEEITKRNDEIRKLKGDLHQIEKFSEEHIRRTKTEAEKQQQADMKNSEGKQSKLTAELQALKTQQTNLIAEHRKSELALRKRKYKIETEVENWIQKYDQDMGERQDEYEDVDAVYTEEKSQLNELEERFKTLETEYTTIVEERRIAKEKKEREERELSLMIKAATVVQAFWRSYKCRKALKAKNKKKKGKGKKKSGKK
ncbi:dynein regulatory complex protein 10-like [Anneissia japonica]|uniref:dynein regulatory complex protein 10-like n=1 Tax=Anneissia japonica TaxID=1529436 RepID=UPI00142554FB|nr:dynein regulatory complex protein 10-like [Anneissia japonica]